MSTNFGRQFLVTKFKCSVCGFLLNLSYEAPQGIRNYAEDEPTGSEKVEQFVAIEPCPHCMKPYHDLSRAIKLIVTHGDKA